MWRRSKPRFALLFPGKPIPAVAASDGSSFRPHEDKATYRRSRAIRLDLGGTDGNSSPTADLLAWAGVYLIGYWSIHFIGGWHHARRKIQGRQCRACTAAHQARNARLGRPAPAARRRFARICLALRAIH